jgi:PAS domain S-box-containing protein
MRGESIGRAAAGSRAAPGGTDAGSDDLLALLAAVDDWVFVLSADGHILRASAIAQARLGLEPAGGGEFVSLWRKDQRVPLAAALSKVGEGTRTERILLDTHASPEARIELRLTLGKFRGEPAVFGIGRELGRIPEDSSYLRATAALSDIERKYHALWTSSMFAIALNDERGRYLEVNPAFERIIGWSAAEAAGKDPFELELIPADLQQKTIAELDRHGTPQFATMQFKRRDGALRVALHSTTRVLLDDAPIAFTISFDVTDFLRTQEALRDQDQQFRALFDNVKDGMFFAGPGGRFYEVNDAACEQLGYTREELLQLTVAQVSNTQGFDFDHLAKRFDEAANVTYETEHRRKDGIVIPVELTLTRIEYRGVGAVVGIARDLTVRKRIQNELRDARDRLQATLQALPDLVFEFDSDGVIQDYFSSRPDLLTVPPERFLGKKLDELTNPEIATTLITAVHEALEKGLSMSTQYRVRNGRWFEMTAARRSDIAVGQKPRVIAVARDITDRKLREQELESKNDELMRFTYTVSHDLKSPLVTIKSFIGYLILDLKENQPDKVATDISYIQNAADRMDQLLDDLLELSRIGRKVNPPERLSLRGLCNEACDLIAGRIKNYAAEVVLPERDVFLWGDRVRLLEVLQNLLDNALKFSQSVQPVRVFVEIAQRQGEWIVSVRDRGIGVDPRHQHKLFGLFEKLHTGEGTGIGLALVKRIIEVHGGRVWLESAGDGHGTTVSFTLPNTEAEAAS